MTWRVAKSILVLRSEVDAVAPRRNKASDGTVGDASHATRTSDHNPYIRDARGLGVVRAVDVTHDPAGGLDANKLAEHARILGARGDKRLRYVIWNHRIASGIGGWAWRSYSGSNPHTKHVHISVSESPSGYDSGARWGFSKSAPGATWLLRDRLPLQKGHKDGKRKLVSRVQRRLDDEPSGRFTSGTEKAVKRWQTLHDEKGRRVVRGRGLKVDGIVGSKTWSAMFEGATETEEPSRAELSGSSAGPEQRPGERRRDLTASVAEFRRLEEKALRAWEKVASLGGRQRRALAETRGSSRELSAILLRIEEKLEALVELERRQSPAAQAPLVTAGLTTEGGSPVSTANEKEIEPSPQTSSKSDPPTTLKAGGNGAGGVGAGRALREDLKGLSDGQILRRIEELDSDLARSRAALIRRYLKAHEELTRVTRGPDRPERPRRSEGKGKPSPRNRPVAAKRQRKTPPERRAQPGPDPEETRSLQSGLNAFTEKFLKGLGPILVDGKKGPATRKRIVLAKYHLGYRGREQRSAEITTEFLKHLRAPRSVKPGMLARALERRRKQRKNARGGATGGAGVAMFDGRPVASWMMPHLGWARKQGWKGTVISGYRDPAYSEEICRQQCGAPRCSGTCAGRASNHSGKVQPAGALDVSEYVLFAELMQRCPHSPRIFNALGPADPNHFSATGR